MNKKSNSLIFSSPFLPKNNFKSAFSISRVCNVQHHENWKTVSKQPNKITKNTLTFNIKHK